MKERIQIFLSIEFVVATLALFFNDMFLKDYYPGLLTGKLSDFAGLFIFPLFLYALVGKRKLFLFLLTAIAFIIWKSPISSGLINVWNLNSPIQIGRTVDYSDLFALTILPLAYYFKPKQFISFQNSVFKYTFASFVLFCIVASETTEIRFKNKVKGHNPYSLIGNYELYVHASDTSYIDTISIERIRISNYLIVRNYQDTLYSGEIRKKKGDYFLNQLDKETGFWKISSFRLKNDSAYEFYSAIWGTNAEIIEQDYFDNYEKIEKEDIITYFIDNNRKETLTAFSKILDNSTGVYFKEIINQEDTLNVQISNASNHISGKIESLIDLKIYPNPVINHLTIDQINDTNSTIRLINLSGHLIKEEKMNDRKMTWDLSDLPSGTYVLELTTSDGKMLTEKMIKK